MAARLGVLPVAVVGTLLACVGDASAADWTFDPKVALFGEYNDNNRLYAEPAPQISVTGASLDAQVGIKGATPTTTFRLTPRLRSTFFPGDEDEETDNQYVTLKVARKGERNNLALDADYSRVEMVGDYLPGAEVREDDQLGNPEPGTDIGQVNGRNRQDRVYVAPEASFELMPRHAIAVRAEYLDVAYDVQELGDQQDFSSLSGQVSYQFQLSRTGLVSVSASLGQYDPDIGETTDGYGLSANWTNRVSETSEVFVTAGTTRVESAAATTGGSSDWESGFAGGAGVRWQFEVTQVFFDVNRYLDPNSAGKVITRDQLRLELRRRLRPTTNLFVGVRGIKDGDAADGSDFQARTYAVANVGFEWRMTRQFTLVGRYDYSWQEYDDAPNDASSNAVRLGVVYQPNRR